MIKYYTRSQKQFKNNKIYKDVSLEKSLFHLREKNPLYRKESRKKLVDFLQYKQNSENIIN